MFQGFLQGYNIPEEVEVGLSDELEASIDVHSALKPVALVQAGPAVLLDPDTNRTGAHYSPCQLSDRVQFFTESHTW